VFCMLKNLSSCLTLLGEGWVRVRIKQVIVHTLPSQAN
jgi:hypothetical protein